MRFMQDAIRHSQAYSRVSSFKAPPTSNISVQGTFEFESRDLRLPVMRRFGFAEIPRAGSGLLCFNADRRPRTDGKLAITWVWPLLRAFRIVSACCARSMVFSSSARGSGAVSIKFNEAARCSQSRSDSLIAQVAD